MINIMEVAGGINDMKKERNNNILRAKVIDAINNKNANTPEMLQNITKIEIVEIDAIIDGLEKDGFIVCNTGGSKDNSWSFEVIKKLE